MTKPPIHLVPRLSDVLLTEEQADSVAHILWRFKPELPAHIISAPFGDDDVVLVLIAGMTIGIEPDGYAHS